MDKIYTAERFMICLEDIQHIEKTSYGWLIITSHTTWNYGQDCWENNLFVKDEEIAGLREAWRNYKNSEIKEIIKDEPISLFLYQLKPGDIFEYNRYKYILTSIRSDYKPINGISFLVAIDNGGQIANFNENTQVSYLKNLFLLD